MLIHHICFLLVMDHHGICFSFLFWLCLIFLFVPLLCASHFCEESCESSTLYGAHKRFRIYLLTFNVAGNDNSDILEDLLFDGNVKSKPDMYAIALEEIPTFGLLKNSKTFDELQGLMEDHHYYLVAKASNKKTPTVLYVYAADEHQKQILNVEDQSYNFAYNSLKSSMAVRFTYDDPDSGITSTFCIIGAYFMQDEGQENYEKRIGNFKNTMEHIKFKAEPIEIKDHDNVIFMGDLNFRLSDDIDRNGILNLIKKQQWLDLLKHDELKKAQIGFKTTDTKQNVVTWKAFKNFREADIKFAPTYKFAQDDTTKEQKSHYDEGKKNAPPVRPAYTDRILAKKIELDPKLKDDKVGLPYEKSLMSFVLSSYHAFPPSGKLKIYSDHRPVRAIYEVPLWAAERTKNRILHYGKESKPLER